MFRNASHIRGDVTGSLEPRRHPGFDLRLEGAVDGGETKTWMTTVQPLVKLLRGHGLPFGGERLSDDDALLREPSAARGDPLRERRAGHRSWHVHSVLRLGRISSMILIKQLRAILANDRGADA